MVEGKRRGKQLSCPNHPTATSALIQVARSFCHLNKQREANKNGQCNIPGLRVVHEPKAEERNGLEDKAKELGPDAATESKALEKKVAADAT